MADWDTFSEDYDRIFLENPVYLHMIDMMADAVTAVDGSEVLDLGCGTGNVSAKLVERAGEGRMRVTAVDPSAGMRRHCRERFEGVEVVEVLEGDALDIPAADGSFDFALSNLVLHHVPPERRADCAGELARVLRPGGLLVYADMFCDVDSDPRDPVRVRDIVDKMVGLALFCLDHGAWDMMQVMLATLPADISSEGEYLTTPGVWSGELKGAGFRSVEVAEVPPEEFGLKILLARR